jgi:DNA-binding transcriptional regulator YbjK
MVSAAPQADGPLLPQSERRRQAILEATLRIIAAGGVDLVTHRRVAAEAEVPLGSTTYYFASREDLLREAFRHYVAGVFASLTELEGEMPVGTGVDGVVDFLVELARREFSSPDILIVEYEFILRAARDAGLAREFNAYERALVARLAEALERLGAPQAVDAARTLIALFRGFEIERFTRPSAGVEDLRRRLLPIVTALVRSDGASGRATRPSVHPRLHKRKERAR